MEHTGYSVEVSLAISHHDIAENFAVVHNRRLEISNRNCVCRYLVTSGQIDLAIDYAKEHSIDLSKI